MKNLFDYDIKKNKGLMFFSSSSVKDTKLLHAFGIKEILVSYHYISKSFDFYSEFLPKLHADKGLFMTDSGGFSFIAQLINKGELTDETREEKYWLPYLHSYVDWLTENAEYIFVAANLDLDAIVGREVVDKWNEKYFKPLEKLMNIVYVAHRDINREYNDYDGLNRLSEYCKKYPYVGVSQEYKNYASQVCLIARNNKSVIHGFAWTSIPMLQQNPLFSVDSSVDGKSSVVVKHGSVIERLPIEELFLKLHSYRTTKTELRCNTEGYYTITVVDNKIVWSPLKSVVKHEVKKKLIRLTIEGGKEIVVTSDHSMISMDHNGKLFEVSAETLSTNDFVLSNSHVPLNEASANKVKITIEKTVNIKKYGTYSVKIDTILLEFIGLWIGDGSYPSENSIAMSCYSDIENRLIINEIAGRFGAKVTEKPNGVDCSISNKFLRTFMNEIGLKGHSHTKRVPSFIHSLNESGICSFLRGYFSADGTGNGLGCSTVSEELKNDIEHLLIALKIYPSISYRPHGSFKKNGKTYNKRESWSISIRDTNSRKVYLGKISFTQAYKQNALYSDIILNHKKDQSWSKKLGVPNKLSLTGRVKYRRDNILIEKAKGTRVCRFRNDINFSPDVINTELLFLKILSICTISEHEPVTVYDLEVPETEKFFANGILVHNTTWLGGVRYGTSYVFDGKNFRVNDWKKKYLRKGDRVLCREYGIDYDALIREETEAINRYNLVGWLGARQEYLRSANLKLPSRTIDKYIK